MKHICKAAILYMGLVCANLALANAHGNAVQECKQRCAEVQKPCEEACKQHVKPAEQRHCTPGCKQGVEACKSECSKQKP